MSKGGSSSQATQIPAWLENAAIQNINKANDVSQIGYTPYYGPDVAALSPMQQQSMQSTGNAASAFGLAPQGFDAMAGMPQAQTFANGMQGYSSAPLYQESVDQFQANRPAQFQAMADMFIDPLTGAPSKNNYQASPEQVQQMFSNGDGGGGVTPTVDVGVAPPTVNSPTADTAYDAIYPQAGSTDLTGGDTFIGDDGNTYTVGGGLNQVDAGLANSVVDFGTTPYDTGSVTEDLNYLPDYSLEGGLPPRDFANYPTGSVTGNSDFLPDYSLEGGLPSANSGNSDYPAAYGADAVPVSSSGIVDPMTTNTDAFGNILEAGAQGIVNNGLLGMGVKALTGNEIIENSGSKDAQVSELSNADARPMTGLLSPAFDNLEEARDNIMSLIGSNGFDAKYDTDNDGKINITDINNIVTLGVDRGTPISQANSTLSDEAAEEAQFAKEALEAKKSKEKATTGGKSSGTVGDKAGNVIKDGSGNAVKFGTKGKVKPKKIVENSGKGDGGGSSAGSSGGGTYCCTKMRDNGKWTSNRRVYKMHKWHFEQPQWWRDGYDVWGKVIADNLLNKDGEFSASVMNDFYENRVNSGKLTPKAALAHAVMYPPIFMIGMVAKVTGKHITKVTITS